MKNSTTGKIIDDINAKKFIDELMNNIISSKSISDLENIPNKIELGEQLIKKMPGTKFPRLRLRISKEEIQTLENYGFLSKDNLLNPTLAEGETGLGKDMTALEKLLYSILWKNGDLGKERLVIEGILNKGYQKNIVFYEFGGYLSGRHSFILDQHTLRCFAIFKSDLNLVSSLRSLENINAENANHLNFVNEYKQFYVSISDTCVDNLEDFMYLVDRLLFGAGKLVKAK